MSTRNDTQRAARKVITLGCLDDILPETKIRVPWEFAVDLGFATRRYTAKGEVRHSAREDPEIEAYAEGVIVYRRTLAQTLASAPRGVRRRIQRIRGVAFRDA